MTEEQSVAYIIAMAAVLNAKVAGMQAQNQQYTLDYGSVYYHESDFEEAIKQSGCHHNTVITAFQPRG